MQETPVTPVQQLPPPPGGGHTCPAGFVLLSHIAELYCFGNSTFTASISAEGWASVHQAAKLVAALLRVAGVTAGLAASNGSLLPGL